MGLQLKVMEDLKGDVNKKREEINKAKAQTPREVNLIGLKK